MQDKRLQGVVAVLFAGLVLLGLWLMLPGDTAPEGPAPQGVVLPDPEPRAAPSPMPFDDEEPVELAAAADDPAVEALAEAAGHGLIRCRLSQDVVGLQVVGVVRHWREGGHVVAEVATPSGQASVRSGPPDKPVLEGLSESEAREAMREYQAAKDQATAPVERWFWEGATPGEYGSCRVEAPTEITLSGRVVGEWPGSSLRVVGCGGSVEVDADGFFSMNTWAGPRCRLWAGFGEVEAVWVDGDRSPSGLVVPVRPHSVTEVFDLRLEAIDAELAALDEAAARAGEALGDGSLVDARIAGERRALQAERDRLEANLEFFEANPLPGSPEFEAQQAELREQANQAEMDGADPR